MQMEVFCKWFVGLRCCGCVGIMVQIQGLIEELDVWFPNQLVMDTMGIVDPQYWIHVDV